MVDVTRECWELLLIIINEDLNIDYVEEVLFHELAHGLLDMEHRDSVINDSIPYSIMHSDLLAQEHYINNRARYLDELFLEEL